MLAELLGGIGLFLLGMWLLTEGLKLAAGGALERALARSTGTHLRGLLSGVLVTALVQSSSAVTVAAIGFVNAGLLTLGQALWVLFGANVGTTTTGWLVAAIGLDFKIEGAALPLVGLGMLLHFTGGGSRRRPAGMALAGFGVLFLGIGVLRGAFGDLGAQITLPGTGEDVRSAAAFVLAGIALTVLTQSSSAALAVALSAAQGGLVPLTGAAGVVIGANVGTTFTAILAALGATANAKRASAAHVVFNVVTAAVALALLPWLVRAIVAGERALGAEPGPALTLAVFHSVFNVLGVLLMWPCAEALERFLLRRFRSSDEDEARPVHLDDNALAVPALALDALEREVRRLGAVALRLARTVVPAEAGRALPELRDVRVVDALGRAIGEFVVRLNASSMAPESARRLPVILRVARYYETVAEVVSELARDAGERDGSLPEPTAYELRSFLLRAAIVLERVDPASADLAQVLCCDPLADFAAGYEVLKACLLEAGARGALDMRSMERLLRRASLTRRVVEQAVKAARTMEAAGPAGGAAGADAGGDAERAEVGPAAGAARS